MGSAKVTTHIQTDTEQARKESEDYVNQMNSDAFFEEEILISIEMKMYEEGRIKHRDKKTNENRYQYFTPMLGTGGRGLMGVPYCKVCAIYLTFSDFGRFVCQVV